MTRTDMRGFVKDLQPLSRRSLLKGCVVAGMGVSAIGIAGCSDPATSTHSYLNAEDARVINRLARVMFPDDDRIFPVNQIPVEDNVSHLLSLVDPSIREDLSVAIKLFDYGAIVLGWHFSRFTSLDNKTAAEYCDRWQNGNDLQRGIASALKKLVYTAYWQDARTWNAVAFDGPVSDKWGLEKLGNAPLPVNQR